MKKSTGFITFLLIFVLLAGTVSAGGTDYILQEDAAATEEIQDTQDIQYNTAYQLTEEDISDMNDGNVLIVYNDEGYVSTLIGRYYDGVINDQEDAVESLNGVASLIGIFKGAEFFCDYISRDADGYTYYTFQQRYDGYTLWNATLKVIVNPDGTAAGLTSSFRADVGSGEHAEGISAEEAEAIVRERYADYDLIYYSECTEQIAVIFDNTVNICWTVYTNNPDAEIGFDMAYLEHFVSTDGIYMQVVPTMSLLSDSQNTFKTDDYFLNLVAEELTSTVTRADGTEITLTVPVSKNTEDGLYYLADPERKIIVADYYSFCYQNWLEFLSSETIDGWDENYLMAYANYIKAYDFYADYGIKSVDGFGTPILITVGYCDEYGNAVDNACYYGNNSGWACFAVSDINSYSQALDVCAHEYTHGVSRQSMQGHAYYNEYGAINEAYSDIMGNICEMSLGETTDTQWLVGETSGEAIRSMSNPNAYSQPTFVGDVYYEPDVINPRSDANDNGGVHANNSLISQIAYKLYKAGMGYDEQTDLWLTALELLTPLSDYDDLHACLLWSARINGFSDFGEIINTAYEEEGLNGDRLTAYREVERSFCGRIEFYVDDTLAAGTHFVIFTDSNGTDTYAFPDANGAVSALLPIGTYTAVFCYVEGYDCTEYVLTSEGWRAGGNPGYISLTNGDVVYLNNLYFSSGDEDADTGDDGAEEPTSYNDDSDGDGTPAGYSKSGLNLITFDGGYFTLTMPEGWRLEVNGSQENGDFSFKMWDPEDPSMEVFTYSSLSPFLKSEAARSIYSLTDYTGLFVNAPVLSPQNAEGLLNVWDECVAYQKMFGSVVFTELYNIEVTSLDYYTGFYSAYGYVESEATASCSTAWDDDCIIDIITAVYDAGEYYVDGIDTQPLGLLGTMGIMAPADEFDAVMEDLAICLSSLEFTE